MFHNKIKLLLMVTVLSLGVWGCGSNETTSNVENTVEESATDASEKDTKKLEEAETNDTVNKESENQTNEQATSVLEDGTYVAEFHTDSGMFHVNEANNDRGILTVENGKMMLHISLTSKNIVNLFPGVVSDAQKEGAELLQPTVDTVTYSDGYTEEVNGFDIPVPAIDEEFDLALIGKKGKWYDHKVVVTNPVPGDDVHLVEGNDTADESNETSKIELADGEYQVDIELQGGSGKSTIESPAKMVVKDGVATVTITWSSPNYDYMLLDGVKYEPVNTEGNSVFELPISALDTEIPVIGDTVAMSKPHEVEYTITCSLK